MSKYLPTVFGENLMDVFDDFDRDFFRGFGNIDRTLYGKHAQHVMKTDVKETDQGYEVDVDLPGFQKDEIHLDVQGDTLTITAEHKEKTPEEKENDEKSTYLRRERTFCSYQQKLDISNIDADQMEASYENGVLTLKMPKKQPAVPEVRQITVK